MSDHPNGDTPRRMSRAMHRPGGERSKLAPHDDRIVALYTGPRRLGDLEALARELGCHAASILRRWTMTLSLDHEGARPARTPGPRAKAKVYERHCLVGDCRAAFTTRSPFIRNCPAHSNPPGEAAPYGLPDRRAGGRGGAP